MKLEPIDYLAPDGAERFVESLRVTGFGVLKNHPIQKGLVDTIYDEWQAFSMPQKKMHFILIVKRKTVFFLVRFPRSLKGTPLRILKSTFTTILGGNVRYR